MALCAWRHLIFSLDKDEAAGTAVLMMCPWPECAAVLWKDAELNRHLVSQMKQTQPEISTNG